MIKESKKQDIEIIFLESIDYDVRFGMKKSLLSFCEVLLNV